jgi:flagellum-specific ATP synthase
LIRIGAYKPGSDAELDQAIRARPAIRRFLEQQASEQLIFQQTLNELQSLEL